MADRPENYRDVKLIAAENGGFILEYDEMGKGGNVGDNFSNRVFLGTKREIFEEKEGDKALKRLTLFSGVGSEHRSDHKEE